jgi:malonyl-CoA/methylmalonyl-CoA synthetase
MFRGLHESDYAELISIAGRSLSSEGLRGAVAALASDLQGIERVAVWAESELETAVGVVAAIAAGSAAVPINPKAGPLELAHIVADSAPGVVLCRPGAELPDALDGVRRLDVDVTRRSTDPLPPEHQPETPILILYTSGTTGLPKGAVLPARAIASNLDALAEAWEWTDADVLVQGLPLFHAHGLVLGTLGPLRLGCRLVHLGRFSPEGVATALQGEGGCCSPSRPCTTGWPKLPRRDPSSRPRSAGRGCSSPAPPRSPRGSTHASSGSAASRSWSATASRRRS